MTARIDSALDAVEDERVSVGAERDALVAFSRRVAELPTVTVSTGPPLVADRSRGGDPSLERVRTAYTETVMDVPHYEAEYGDTLANSLAVEFGDDLAAALVSGSTLTPTVRDAVRAAASSAQREREEFLDVLEREASSLEGVRADVETVQSELAGLDDRPLSTRRFDDLHHLWSQVSDLRARVDGIGLRRQETIRSHRSNLPGVPTDLTEYLYADLSTSYPALASLASLGEELEQARRRTARALASTP